MFIAEINHHPAGMIHLVVKKQGTVKISPLIVAPEYRGKFGVGSELLRYAEKFACKQHAQDGFIVRQLLKTKPRSSFC